MSSGLVAGSRGRSLMRTTFTNPMLGDGAAGELAHSTRHHKDHALAYVLHAVRNALDVVRGPEQVRGLVDGPWVREHDRQKLTVDLLVERVDVVVLRCDGLRSSGIPFHERIQCPSEHADGLVRHAWNIDERLDVRLLT